MAAPQMMAVTCPAGVVPGQMLQITSPSGAPMQVAVPAGVGHVVLPIVLSPRRRPTARAADKPAEAETIALRGTSN